MVEHTVAWALAAAAPGPVTVAAVEFPAHTVVKAPRGAAVEVRRGGLELAAELGDGPLLIARATCPRLGPEHAEAALGDLAAGCGLSLGVSLSGDWYLAALPAPRPELLALLAHPFGEVLRRAPELGLEAGLLRHERALAGPDDAAAFAADPLTAPQLRALLSAS